MLRPNRLLPYVLVLVVLAIGSLWYYNEEDEVIPHTEHTLRVTTVELKHLPKRAKIENKYYTIKKQPDYEIWEVTAYTAGVESTGKDRNHPHYGLTRTQTYVKEGRTIACPENLIFDSQGKQLENKVKVYIPYFDNTFTCEDTGSAIVGNRLDVYMDNLQEALTFGRRELKVLILHQGG